MALQRMILVPPVMWENRSKTLPPPVKKILNSKDLSYIKWTKVRLHQNPFLKSEEQKREPVPIPNVENGGTLSSFKTKSKRKHIIGSMRLFKTETLDSESNILLASAFKVY
jgi:hypothetical protein